MLRTNSTKARQNIQRYIMNYFDGTNFEIEPPETFTQTAAVIMAAFRKEKPAKGGYSRMSEQERFEDWASGLPSILNCCYYWNRSAVDDLGAILEETEQEKTRYTEQDAEKLLTYLIYRELVRGCK